MSINKSKLIGGIFYAAAVLTVPYMVTAAWQGFDANEEIKSGIYISVVDNGRLSEVMLNDYMAGVLALQIDASYGVEALKAQAILTRSYIYNILDGEQYAEGERLKLDYLDKEAREELWGDSFNAYEDKIYEAVRETDGLIMTYDGLTAEGVFHRLSAGKTRDGRNVYPYLVPVDSSEDLSADDYISITEYTFDEFLKKAESLEEGAVFSSGEAISLQIVETDESGYVKTAMIGTKTFEGERIMEVFELKSCAFSFQILENKVRIICCGDGYGYGMSQYGASKMAEGGSNAETILKYYFPGVEIERFSE